MNGLYAGRDWAQCQRCGCTFQHRNLKRLTVTDSVLNLTSEVWECLDSERCLNFKTHRDDELRRDNEIRSRK